MTLDYHFAVYKINIGARFLFIALTRLIMKLQFQLQITSVRLKATLDFYLHDLQGEFEFFC